MDQIQRFSLTGKVALVSGGSRGIGEAISHGLAEHGATVIVSSRKLDACKSVAEKIVENGGTASARQCHAGNMDDISALFTEIEAEHGRLDILVNCGATSLYYGPIGETPVAAFEKTMDVNVRGPFYMSSKAVEIMRECGGGSIINVASINGLKPGPWQGVYSMTKSAVINMTQSFARDYGQDGIRVNAILPGLVETKMTSGFTQDDSMISEFTKRQPLRKTGQPEDMVGGVIYLASDAAGYTTGTTLLMDGGQLLQDYATESD